MRHVQALEYFGRNIHYILFATIEHIQAVVVKICSDLTQGVLLMDGPGKKLNRIAEFLQAFQQLEREDPTAAECVRLLLAGQPSHQASAVADEEIDEPAALWGDTHFERICQLYCHRQNPWLSVSDIRLGTDIGRGAIAQVLYTTYKESFVRKPHPSHAKMKVWSLTSSAYAAAKERSAEHYESISAAPLSSDVAKNESKEPVMMH